MPADPGVVERQAAQSRLLLLALALGSTLIAFGVAALLFARLRAARRSSELRTDFVSAVSHELRTPIASVRMFAELLEEDRVEPGERREVVDAIARESRRLGETVDRLLGFSRMAAGRALLERQLGSVAGPVAASIDRFEQRHPELPAVERALDEAAAGADRRRADRACRRQPAGKRSQVCTRRRAVPRGGGSRGARRRDPRPGSRPGHFAARPEAYLPPLRARRRPAEPRDGRQRHRAFAGAARGRRPRRATRAWTAGPAKEQRLRSGSRRARHERSTGDGAGGGGRREPQARADQDAALGRLRGAHGSERGRRGSSPRSPSRPIWCCST